MTDLKPHHRQQGAVLIVSLLLLMALTILSIATVRNSTMEMRMAQNSQFKIEAFQHAQSIHDFLFETFVDDSDELPVSGAVDDHVCVATGTTVVSTSPCYGVTAAFSLPSFLQGNDSDKAVELTAQRIAPERALPPVTTKTSLDRFWAAFFEAEAVYDANALGQGKIPCCIR